MLPSALPRHDLLSDRNDLEVVLSKDQSDFRQSGIQLANSWQHLHTPKPKSCVLNAEYQIHFSVKIISWQQWKYKCHLYVPISISNIFCMHLLKYILNLHQEMHMISEKLLVYLHINILTHRLSNTQTKVTEMNYFTYNIQKQCVVNIH